MQKDFELKVEVELNKLKEKMQKALIESDLLRTQAVSKLEVLEKIDTKSDANEIKKLLHEMVASMANNKQLPITINKIV
jgi:dipeptidase